TEVFLEGTRDPVADSLCAPCLRESLHAGIRTDTGATQAERWTSTLWRATSASPALLLPPAAPSCLRSSRRCTRHSSSPRSHPPDTLRICNHKACSCGAEFSG